jgi:hypothetical protein
LSAQLAGQRDARPRITSPSAATVREGWIK